MTMTPPDAQDPDDLSEQERELLPGADDTEGTDDTVDPGTAARVDEDNVPHPPAEENG